MAIDCVEAAPVAVPLTLDEAFRAHAGYVASVAHRLLGRDAEVDDVVQDVFLDAMKGLTQLRGEGTLRAWLRVVAVRKCRRRLTTRRLKGMLGFDDTPAYETVAAKDASPEQRTLLARIYAILDELPSNDRIAWTLRYVEEEKLEDVARLAECSLATAKRRIASAERHIRARLNDEAR